MMGLSQGGAVETSSVPEGKAESDPVEASISDTDQGSGEDPPAVLSEREAHELINWGRLPATVGGRDRGQSQRLKGERARHQPGMKSEVAVAMVAAAFKWIKSRSIVNTTYKTTEDAMSLRSGCRICCGEEIGVMHTNAEWFAGRSRTAPVVRSRCRAFRVQTGVARGHEHRVGRPQNER